MPSVPVRDSGGISPVEPPVGPFSDEEFETENGGTVVELLTFDAGVAPVGTAEDIHKVVGEAVPLSMNEGLPAGDEAGPPDVDGALPVGPVLEVEFDHWKGAELVEGIETVGRDSVGPTFPGDVCVDGLVGFGISVNVVATGTPEPVEIAPETDGTVGKTSEVELVTGKKGGEVGIPEPRTVSEVLHSVDEEFAPGK